MITLGVLVSYKDKYLLDDIYLRDYQLMYDYFYKNGVNTIRVSFNKYNVESKEFSEYVIIDNNGVKIIKEKIKPNILWKRVSSGNFFCNEIMRKEYTIFPSMLIEGLSSDKYESYLFFKKYQPKTILLNSFLKSEKIRKSFGNKVVLKSIRSYGGSGVELLDNEFLNSNKEKYNGLGNLFIVQELKDFSKGYDNLVSGVHDVRICFIGGKLSFVYIREGAKGDFKSNIHTGGTGYGVNVEDIPKDLILLSKEISGKVDDGKSVYSIDFSYCSTDKKWYMVEISSSPGTKGEKEGVISDWQKKYFDGIISLAKK